MANKKPVTKSKKPNPFAKGNKMPPAIAKAVGPPKSIGESVCPECGGKMAKGVCTVCGYKAGK